MYTEDSFGMRRGAVPCISISTYIRSGYGIVHIDLVMDELETSSPERVSGSSCQSLGLVPIINHNRMSRACM